MSIVKQNKDGDKYEITISQLPHEIIFYLLSFIPINEKIRNQRICQEWKYIINNRDIVIKNNKQGIMNIHKYIKRRAGVVGQVLQQIDIPINPKKYGIDDMDLFLYAIENMQNISSTKRVQVKCFEYVGYHLCQLHKMLTEQCGCYGVSIYYDKNYKYTTNDGTHQKYNYTKMPDSIRIGTISGYGNYSLIR